MRFIKRLRDVKVSRAAWARTKVGVGAVLAAVGAGLVYVPAGLIVGGLLLAALGLFLTDVDGS